MANTFTVTNLASSKINVCGETVDAGATESVRLDQLVEQPAYAVNVANYMNAGSISLDIPEFTEKLSLIEQQALDWVMELAGHGIDTLRTRGEFHAWADGTNGDDANDGRTEITAKKTIRAAANLLPSMIKHNAVLHLRGDHAAWEGTISLPHIAMGGTLYVDGGGDFANVAGPWTADISSTTTIGLSTLGAAVDQYKGWWVRILDGPAAGMVRTIQTNDATTFTPTWPWGDWSPFVDPGNAQFEIVRPATQISGRTSFSFIGPGFHRIQRIYISQAFSILQNWAAAELFGFSSIIVNNGRNWTISPAAMHTWLLDYFNDPDNNFAYNSQQFTGVSGIGTTSFLMYQGLSYSLDSVVANVLTIDGGRPTIKNGSSFKKVVLRDVSSSSSFPTLYSKKDWGYADVLVSGSPDIGIFADGGHVQSWEGVTVQNCASHAIEQRNGNTWEMFAFLPGTMVAGSGNGGAGLHTTERCLMKFPDGDPPLVTGTVGDVSIDGTTQQSTWAAIDGGTPINGATVGNDEFVIVKER